MIVDTLKNLNKYYPMHKSLEKVDSFLKEFFAEPKPDGKYEIDGEKVFASVSRYETKSAQGRLCEAHRKYIDLQFIASGRECIGWAPVSEMKEETEEFSKGGDIAFYSGDCKIWTSLEVGYFSILFPQDAHLPCVTVGNDRNVTKIVVKIAVE